MTLRIHPKFPIQCLTQWLPPNVALVLQAFIDFTPQQLQRVVSTNMTGTLLCTRAAMQVMQKQEGGGHIFNMDGAGADGMPTPQYAAYGATKAGMPDRYPHCVSPKGL